MALHFIRNHVVVFANIGPEGKSFMEIVWMSLMRTLDAGTMGGDEGSWPFLVSMLAVTFGGVFIISSLIGILTSGLEAKLVGLLLSQIAENKSLNAVFKDLFDPEGSEIYLKPASDYVKIGMPVSFYTVTESASMRNEIPIGYRINALADDAEKANGVVINPNKAATMTFASEDQLVVIAES